VTLGAATNLTRGVRAAAVPSLHELAYQLAVADDGSVYVAGHDGGDLPRAVHRPESDRIYQCSP
jgi:hypothetical protein